MKNKVEVDRDGGIKYIKSSGDDFDVIVLGSKLFKCNTAVMGIGKILYAMAFYEHNWSAS